METTIKGIEQGQVVVGKVKHPKVGMLPTNVILFSAKGDVEDLGLELNWVQEPLVFKTDIDLNHKEGYAKAIKSHGRTLDKETFRKLECIVEAMAVSSVCKNFINREEKCVTLQLSKNHGIDLSDNWM